jgi:hypothetical protein
LSPPRLDIPGARDEVVRMYTKWQQSQVDDQMWKYEFQKACEVALCDCLDLLQIYGDNKLGYDVKKAIVHRFANDIEYWLTT